LNKLFPLTAGLILGGLSLSACAGQTPAADASSTTTAIVTPSPTPTATVAAKTSAAPVVTKAAASREDQIEAIYLAGAREDQPGLASAEDDGMITIGRGFCKMYDGGATTKDVTNYILKAAGWAYTVPQLTSMLGAAVGALCPQHIDKLGT